MAALFLSGCATIKNLRAKNEEQMLQIQSLNNEITRLSAELDKLNKEKEEEVRRRLASDQMKEELRKDVDELAQAKSELEDKLAEEIKKGELIVAREAKGLVVSVVAEVLFDSGKDILKESSRSTLDKIIGVITSIPDKNINIEGHTDDEPIRYSGWKSNWELSCARALSVVHYFIETGSVEPTRLSVSGYGEYHPLADNSTEEGKAKNRRVEIVILPSRFTKERAEGPQTETPQKLDEENLK